MSFADPGADSRTGHTATRAKAAALFEAIGDRIQDAAHSDAAVETADWYALTLSAVEPAEDRGCEFEITAVCEVSIRASSTIQAP